MKTMQSAKSSVEVGCNAPPLIATAKAPGAAFAAPLIGAACRPGIRRSQRK